MILNGQEYTNQDYKARLVRLDKLTNYDLVVDVNKKGILFVDASGLEDYVLKLENLVWKSPVVIVGANEDIKPHISFKYQSKVFADVALVNLSLKTAVPGSMFTNDRAEDHVSLACVDCFIDLSASRMLISDLNPTYDMRSVVVDRCKVKFNTQSKFAPLIYHNQTGEAKPSYEISDIVLTNNTIFADLPVKGQLIQTGNAKFNYETKGLNLIVCDNVLYNICSPDVLLKVYTLQSAKIEGNIIYSPAVSSKSFLFAAFDGMLDNSRISINNNTLATESGQLAFWALSFGRHIAGGQNNKINVVSPFKNFNVVTGEFQVLK